MSPSTTSQMGVAQAGWHQLVFHFNSGAQASMVVVAPLRSISCQECLSLEVSNSYASSDWPAW